MVKYKNILVVEDDKSSAFLLQLLLREMELVEVISFAVNGEEALDYLHRIKDNGGSYPEYIFLDINMPVMDGFEFLEKYRKAGFIGEPPTEIIVLSSSKHRKDMLRAQELGIYHYLNKPISEEEVLLILAQTGSDNRVKF
jgi:CheY-like chemotaxis protein